MDQKCFGNCQTCTVLAIKLHHKTNTKTDHVTCLPRWREVKISHLLWIHLINKQHAHEGDKQQLGQRKIHISAPKWCFRKKPTQYTKYVMHREISYITTRLADPQTWQICYCFHISWQSRGMLKPFSSYLVISLLVPGQHTLPTNHILLSRRKLLV